MGTAILAVNRNALKPKATRVVNEAPDMIAARLKPSLSPQAKLRDLAKIAF